jgi:hypothetical protein
VNDDWAWPPDDDDEHRSHHRELWDEQAARAEQEAEDWRRYADPRLGAEERRDGNDVDHGR